MLPIYDQINTILRPICNLRWPLNYQNVTYTIQNQDIYELKIAENFNEFIGANVDDEDMKFEDTAKIVDTYIDAVDTDLDKDKIKVQMRELMTEAQALEIAWYYLKLFVIKTSYRPEIPLLKYLSIAISQL